MISDIIEFDVACLGPPSMSSEERYCRACLRAAELLEQLFLDHVRVENVRVHGFKRDPPGGSIQWAEMEVITDFSVVHPLVDGDYVVVDYDWDRVS